jgi:Holliday junction resolvasome RuvABC endonuclease subunit
MKTLGIDQSYKSCAVVVMEDDVCTNFEIFKKDDTEDVYHNAAAIARKIGNKVTKVQPDLVILEGLSFGNLGNMTRDLAGLQFAIIIYLRYHLHYEPEIVIVPPPTLKKFATGNGRAEKQDMIDKVPANTLALFKEAGYKKTTGLADLADAYHLAKYGQLKYPQDK